MFMRQVLLSREATVFTPINSPKIWSKSSRSVNGLKDKVTKRKFRLQRANNLHKVNEFPTKMDKFV